MIKTLFNHYMNDSRNEVNYYEEDGKIMETEQEDTPLFDYTNIELNQCSICYEERFCFNACSNCFNLVCEDCNENINKCPFCRQSYKESDIIIGVYNYDTLEITIKKGDQENEYKTIEEAMFAMLLEEQEQDEEEDEELYYSRTEGEEYY